MASRTKIFRYNLNTRRQRVQIKIFEFRSGTCGESYNYSYKTGDSIAKTDKVTNRMNPHLFIYQIKVEAEDRKDKTV